MASSPLPISCPKCKASMPAKAKFCNRCGTKIAPPATVRPEKKPISHRPDMSFAEFFEFAGQSALQVLNTGEFKPHFLVHDQASNPYQIWLTGTKDNMRNSIIMGLMKTPWKYFVIVLEATARGALSMPETTPAEIPMQTGMDLIMIEGISREGDYDVAVFLNGQRIEGKVESWGGGMALKNLYQQARDYAAQPHVDLHINKKKYGNAANFVVVQDQDFSTKMWNAINEKNLEVVVEEVSQKARAAAPTMDLKGEEVSELAFEIFVRIVQDIPLVDEVKIPLSTDVKNRLFGRSG